MEKLGKISEKVAQNLHGKLDDDGVVMSNLINSTQKLGNCKDANGNPISYDELLVITIKEDVNAASEAMRIRNRGIKQGTMYEFTPSQAHQEDPATADNNVFMGGGQAPAAPTAPTAPTNGAPQPQRPQGQFPGNGRQH